MTVLPDLRARLTHHACPGETCGDLLCGAAREIERLKSAIECSLTAANGRWSEWGARAESVEEILSAAARNAKEVSRE